MHIHLLRDIQKHMSAHTCIHTQNTRMINLSINPPISCGEPSSFPCKVPVNRNESVWDWRCVLMSIFHCMCLICAIRIYSKHFSHHTAALLQWNAEHNIAVSNLLILYCQPYADFMACPFLCKLVWHGSLKEGFLVQRVQTSSVIRRKWNHRRCTKHRSRRNRHKAVAETCQMHAVHLCSCAITKSKDTLFQSHL